MLINQTSTATEPVSFFLSDGAAVAKGETPQENAVKDAAAQPARVSRPADLRLHLGPFFLRIIVGKERRSPDRLRQDRTENPAFTLRNLPLIVVIWLLSGAALLYFLGRMLTIIAQM